MALIRRRTVNVKTSVHNVIKMIVRYGTIILRFLAIFRGFIGQGSVARALRAQAETSAGVVARSPRATTGPISPPADLLFPLTRAFEAHGPAARRRPRGVSSASPGMHRVQSYQGHRLHTMYARGGAANTP